MSSPDFGGGEATYNSAAEFSRLNAAIAANPGVFASAADEATYIDAVKAAADHVGDVKKKAKILDIAMGVITGGVTGGLPGALGALIGRVLG